MKNLLLTRSRTDAFLKGFGIYRIEEQRIKGKDLSGIKKHFRRNNENIISTVMLRSMQKQNTIPILDFRPGS